MKKTILEMMLIPVLIAVLTLASNNQLVTTISSSMGSNFLKNGDFEAGTFQGWDVGGVCTISNTVVHGGSFSAYISDAVYDSWIQQVFLPNTRLPVDSGLELEGFVYPLKVGSLGSAENPVSIIHLKFYSASTMQYAFEIKYVWCWCDNAKNTTDRLHFWLPFNASEWNRLSRNVTEDIYSYWGSMDYSDIVLYSIVCCYHYSNASPGAFYVDDLKILVGGAQPTEIHEVNFFPTCPPPYVASSQPRVKEPILIKANVTGQYVETVLLKFRSQGEQWFNVTMMFDEAESLWIQTIPGQSKNCTIEFFVEAWSTYGVSIASSLYRFYVKPLLACDINGDGIVNMWDIGIAARSFGQTSP